MITNNKNLVEAKFIFLFVFLNIGKTIFDASLPVLDLHTVHRIELMKQELEDQADFTMTPIPNSYLYIYENAR
jgi:hypothetical protein